jgi:hypothetical protein
MQELHRGTLGGAFFVGTLKYNRAGEETSTLVFA